MQALGWALAYRDHVIRLAALGHFSPAHPDEVRRAKSVRSDATLLAYGSGRSSDAPDGLTKHCVTA
jgi:hypothetical protein